MSMPDWRVEDFGSEVYLDGIEARFCIKADDDIVGYAFEPERARLIAVAPELLSHLRLVAFHLRREDITGRAGLVGEMLDAIEGAIAKATQPSSTPKEPT
jgi:hypothetical protein